MYWPTGGVHSGGDVLPILALCIEVLVQCFLYQGMLDIHGWLYSPNAGEKLGHLPADNFLDFVQRVTTDMIQKSGTAAQLLPYTLDLKPHAAPVGTST
eukprot:430902-Prymnesium_polylepis.1